MKTFDDIQLLSIYNRYIIKENTQNYQNPLLAFEISNESLAQAINKMNQGIFELHDKKFNLSDLLNPNFKWVEINDGFATENDYQFQRKILPTSILNDSENVFLNLREQFNINDADYLAYELSANLNRKEFDNFKIELKITDNYEPILTPILTDNIKKIYAKYDINQTFLPRKIAAIKLKNNNMFVSARAIS